MKLSKVPRVPFDLPLRLVRVPVDVARSLLGLTSEDGEMRAPPVADPPPAAATRSRPPSHDEIAARAFELYEHGTPGGPEQHWAAAERELSTREA
jgi:hypothetical protein